MDTDDQIAAAAERARDEDTERAHGGNGVEVIERYTDAEWLDCMADLILPDTEKDAREIREQLAGALRWSQRKPSIDDLFDAANWLDVPDGAEDAAACQRVRTWILAEIEKAETRKANAVSDTV